MYELMLVVFFMMFISMIVVEANTFPHFKLTYFEAKGAAEISRILFKIGKVDFEDNRFTIRMKPEGGFNNTGYDEAKQRGDFKANLNRVPILEINGDVKVGQSKAIERYIAKKCHLMGSNDEESAVIDCVAEHVRDIKDRFIKVVSDAGKPRSPERISATMKWLGDGEYSDWLKRLEESLPVNSKEFAVGSKLSYADVSIWHLINEYYEDKVLSNAAAAPYKRLMKISQAVASNPEVKKWLLERPMTLF